ncbi:hypothetical protein CONPUDRAFT_140126 [Coniophora puteana RWD-64-598 SS2]|uniref:Transcriptional repressor Tup1 N-terminal domain-containing protein n=1 Tax=Coniophora puteana (strain RWD-64-598) TaxID=741705 RepID=A0A5M3M714_CONPW|nr:uncharacterized protein CONPUDRAFT_140126 [Coniophora puteana RWD-64-598 SS2]EIW75132.1 hypothetical protein CONPUDRAFT_140126 [Coniophora puteana RWD-64-598 SS2]
MAPESKPMTSSVRPGGGRYKEKFQQLRERYDQVNALHDEYERNLELAKTRMRKLQEENDLLLDAIALTIPEVPPGVPHPEQDPAPYYPQPGYAPKPPHAPNGSLNGSGTNGVSHSYREPPPDMAGPPGEYMPRELNGRA